MDVTIHERHDHLFTEYDITAPNSAMVARREVFKLFHTIDLRAVGGQPLAKLKGQFSVLRDRYEFELADGRICRFECVDRWNGVYECRYDGGILTLYQHRGLSHSIFAGDRQIAAYTQNRVVVGNLNKYEVRMDSDADLVLIVSIVLAVSMSDDNDERGIVHVSGSFTQARAFDETWQPR